MNLKKALIVATAISLLFDKTYSFLSNHETEIFGVLIFAIAVLFIVSVRKASK